METQTVCACGATVPPDAAWCPRCLAPRAAQPSPDLRHRAFAPAGAPGSTSAVGPLAATRPAPVGRFAKTDVSFGLTGRIVLTVLLLLPLAVFVALATQLIGIGGLVVYGGIVCPWALRDLWRDAGRGRRR